MHYGMLKWRFRFFRHPLYNVLAAFSSPPLPHLTMFIWFYSSNINKNVKNEKDDFHMRCLCMLVEINIERRGVGRREP